MKPCSKYSIKVAVTGASGFIGRYVLKELIKRRVQVVAVTRRADNLSDFASEVSVVELDIANPPENSFIQMGSPDVLIHLAWDGLRNYTTLHHFESELPKQYTFLKAVIEQGLSSVLVSGTCFEYGMQSGELSEELKPCPANTYGYAKDALRRQLDYLKAARPFNLTWGRLFYLYGEGQYSTSIYPALKKAVTNGEVKFPMSGGEQLRDYLPVTEVALILVRLALAAENFGTVNVCSGRPFSIRHMVEMWLAENGWSIELELGRYPYPDYEPMAFWGSPSRMNKLLATLQ